MGRVEVLIVVSPLPLALSAAEDTMSIKVTGDARICSVMEKTMEECKPGCVKFFDKYNECVARLGPTPQKGLDCQLQYFDYYRCLDGCV